MNKCVDLKESILRLLSSIKEGNLEKTDLETIIFDRHFSAKMLSFGYHLNPIPPELLKEPIKSHSLDSYYGVIDFYGWNKTKIEDGLDFAHIFYLMEKIRSKYPQEDEVLSRIYRKNAYLILIDMEATYLVERYDWSKKTDIREIFLAKFENFVTSSIEQIITSINLYERIILNRSKIEVNNFTDVIVFLNKGHLPSYENGKIFNTTYILIYIYVRNCLVHDFSGIKYVGDYDNPALELNISPDSEPHLAKLFIMFIKERFKEYQGDKSPNSIQLYTNPTSSELAFEFHIDGKGTVDPSHTKISLKMNMIKFMSKMIEDLILLQDDLFTTIKDKIET